MEETSESVVWIGITLEVTPMDFGEEGVRLWAVFTREPYSSRNRCLIIASAVGNVLNLGPIGRECLEPRSPSYLLKVRQTNFVKHHAKCSSPILRDKRQSNYYRLLFFMVTSTSVTIFAEPA